MIEWKAVIYSVLLGLAYFIYRKYKSQFVTDAPSQPTLQVDVLNSIEELHELKRQYTNISQFLFDYEQEKDNTYQLTFIDATGTRHTADIIKANDCNAYLKATAEEQQLLLKHRIEEITTRIYSTLQEQPKTSNGIISIIYQTYVKRMNNSCLSNVSEDGTNTERGLENGKN